MDKLIEYKSKYKLLQNINWKLENKLKKYKLSRQKYKAKCDSLQNVKTDNFILQSKCSLLQRDIQHQQKYLENTVDHRNHMQIEFDQMQEKLEMISKICENYNPKYQSK